MLSKIHAQSACAAVLHALAFEHRRKVELKSTGHGRVRLVLQTRDDVREEVEQMPDVEKAELSAEWFALLEGSTLPDP